MERDPVRFVWRAAPGLNLALIILAIASVPCLWAILDLVRSAVDDAAFGRAFTDRSGTAPFMRYAIVLPERILDGQLVLVPGVALAREGFAQATLAALAAISVAAGLFAGASSLLRAAIGRRAIDALARLILSGIASAPVSASDAAQRSALIASDALAGQRTFLGAAIGLPSLSAAMLVGSLAYLAGQDVRLALLAAIGLIAFGLAGRAREGLGRRLAQAEEGVGAALRRSVVDLARHLSALASHGTAAAEQERISAELSRLRAPAVAVERKAVGIWAVALAAALAAPLVVLGAAASLAMGDGLTPGAGVAGAVGAAVAVAALDALLRWQRALGRTRPVFAEIARQLGSFKARRRDGGGASLPVAGTLSADGIVTDGSLQGGRLANVVLEIELPSHVAILGDAASGARSFAGLVGGQIVARAGRMVFGGADIADADPVDRARRLAFAGGETFLIADSLRSNLLYGCPDPDAPDIEERLADAVAVAGLAGFVYRRGLAGNVDPRREPALAAGIVAARVEIAAALARAGLADRVQAFDPNSYNAQATIGENILFGVPLGDTFRDENLPTHGFMRALLDREGLTQPLAALGTGIVRSTIEMFWDLPSRSSIISRFALLSRAERDEFELLLNRQATQQRGAGAARDQARLIGLALRYSESRHRLGLFDRDLEDRILRVRSGFAREIPKSLEAAVEFFRPERLCVATSVLDNLLFGRIAQDRADARADVLPIVREVLDGLDLTSDVIRAGLDARIDPGTSGLVSSKLAAIDLVRCLVRRPDNLVVQRALDDLPEAAAVTMARRLTSAFAGRGLIVVLPRQAIAAADLFDRVVAFESGRVAASASAVANRMSAEAEPDGSERVGARAEPDEPWLYEPARAGADVS